MHLHRPQHLVLAAVLAACSPGSGPPATAAKEPAAATKPAASPPTVSVCDEITARFRETLAGATGSCTADAECACYNPVIGEAGCGGVTDAATGGRLTAIEAEFHAAKCQWPHQCPAQLCAPKCVDGRCR